MEPKLSCCCCCCCLLISRGLILYTRVKQLFLSSECPVVFYFLRRGNVVISLLKHSESSFRKEKHTVTIHCYFKYDSLYIKGDFVAPWLRQSQHPMPLSSYLERSSRFFFCSWTKYDDILRNRNRGVFTLQKGGSVSFNLSK